MKTLRLGTMEISKVYELSAPFPLNGAYPGVGLAELEETLGWYRDDHLVPDLAQAQINLSVHSFVITVGSRHILVDTCNGNDKRRAIPFANMLATDYLAKLGALGLTPSDIDIVLCTHLHCDHVGWNTRLQDGRWVPTFPRARYVFTRPDFDYFSAHPEDPIHGPAFADSVLPVVVAGQADLVETGHQVIRELDHGVWLEGTPGHSPGCCVIHAESRGSHGVFSGDVFHHPIQLTKPSLRFMADHDGAMAADSRQRLLAAHADRDTVFFPGHFADPTAGRVIAGGSAFRYRFEPQD